MPTPLPPPALLRWLPAAPQGLYLLASCGFMGVDICVSLAVAAGVRNFPAGYFACVGMTAVCRIGTAMCQLSVFARPGICPCLRRDASIAPAFAASTHVGTLAGADIADTPYLHRAVTELQLRAEQAEMALVDVKQQADAQASVQRATAAELTSKVEQATTVAKAQARALSLSARVLPPLHDAFACRPYGPALHHPGPPRAQPTDRPSPRLRRPRPS